MYSERVHLNTKIVQEKRSAGQQTTLRIRDNRPSTLVQSKLISSFTSGIPLQRAVVYEQDTYKPVRKLTEGPPDTDRMLLMIGATPGFGQNYATLGTLRYDSCGAGIHSEPALISMKYSDNHKEGDWEKADQAVTKKNTSPGGRDPFILYTERYPCNNPAHNCQRHLNQDIYTPQDKVRWKYPYPTAAATIAQNYLTEAPLAVSDRSREFVTITGSPIVVTNHWRTVKIGIPYALKPQQNDKPAGNNS